MWLVNRLLVSFLFTLAVEVLAAWCWKIRGWENYTVIFLVNIVTNPLLVWGMSFGAIYVERTLLHRLLPVAELAVFALEGMVYKKFKICRHPFGYALAANGLSFGLGELMRYLI